MRYEISISLPLSEEDLGFIRYRSTMLRYAEALEAAAASLRRTMNPVGTLYGADEKEIGHMSGHADQPLVGYPDGWSRGI